MGLDLGIALAFVLVALWMGVSGLWAFVKWLRAD